MALSCPFKGLNVVAVVLWSTAKPQFHVAPACNNQTALSVYHFGGYPKSKRKKKRGGGGGDKEKDDEILKGIVL